MMLAACALFSLGDLMTKILSTNHSAALVVALRYALTLCILLVAVGPRMGRAMFRMERPLLVILRSFALSGASICMTSALRYLPLGEAISIVFLAPFGVMILAGLILGEKVGTTGWLLAGLGFCGVLLIGGPGAGLNPTGVAFAVGSGLATTIYNFMSRFLAGREQPLVLQVYAALVGTLIFSPAFFANAGGFNLSGTDYAALGALGIFFTVAHYCVTLAFAYAAPGALAPVNYVQLIFASGLSYLVYSHIPNTMALIGMVIVMTAGLASVLLQRR